MTDMTIKRSGMPLRVRLIAGTVALAAVVAIAALLLTSGGNVARSVGQPATATSSFSVFSSGTDAVLPPHLDKMVRSVAAGSTPTVRLGSRAGDVSTYLAISGPAICVITAMDGDIGGVGCGHNVAGYAQDTLQAGVMNVDHGYAVSGAAPDGVHDVALTTTAGTQPVTVSNNTYTVLTTDTPKSLAWVGADGANHTYDFVNPDLKPEVN